MSIGRICVREVDLITLDETALVAARRMNDRNVGTLVVIDQNQKPIGIVTDRDLTVRVLAKGVSPVDVAIGDVMTPSPRCVRESTPIEEALQAMRMGPFRRLPVVNTEDKLVGIVSLDDIMELLAEEFISINRLLRAEGPASLAGA